MFRGSGPFSAVHADVQSLIMQPKMRQTPARERLPGGYHLPADEGDFGKKIAADCCDGRISPLRSEVLVEPPAQA